MTLGSKQKQCENLAANNEEIEEISQIIQQETEENENPPNQVDLAEEKLKDKDQYPKAMNQKLQKTE